MSLSDTELTAWVAAAAGAVTTAVTAGLLLWQKYRAVKHKDIALTVRESAQRQKLAHVEQENAIEQWRVIVRELREASGLLQVRVDKLQDEELKCKMELAGTKVRIGELEKRNGELEKRLAHLERAD